MRLLRVVSGFIYCQIQLCYFNLEASKGKRIMDILGILFVALVFMVIATGAIRGKTAKSERFVEDDNISGLHYGGPYMTPPGADCKDDSN